MQIVRTIIWVAALFALVSFSFFNWVPVEVTLWENVVLETKVPVLVVVAFFAGLIPMWIYHRSVKWGLGRRIRSLENAARINAMPQNKAAGEPSSPKDAASMAPPVETAPDPLTPEPAAPGDRS